MSQKLPVNDFKWVKQEELSKFKVGLSTSQKNSFIYLNGKSFKNDEKCLKTLFILEIFKFLS